MKLESAAVRPDARSDAASHMVKRSHQYSVNFRAVTLLIPAPEYRLQHVRNPSVRNPSVFHSLTRAVTSSHDTLFYPPYSRTFCLFSKSSGLFTEPTVLSCHPCSISVCIPAPGTEGDAFLLFFFVTAFWQRCIFITITALNQSRVQLSTAAAADPPPVP